MAQCPHCQLEYASSPERDFCTNCGLRLSDPPAANDLAPAAERLEPGQLAGVTGASEGNVKVQGVGEGSTAGRDVVIHQSVQLMYCAYGGEQVYEDRNFRCPNCGMTPLCAQHYDQDLRKCARCTEEPSVMCAVCSERLPVGQTFTCHRCRRVVGADHRDPAREDWCGDCSAQWANVVEAIEREEVGISMDGTVVGRDDVELRDKVLTTKDGRPVSSIKENMWYARPKQWYRVKAHLLRRERQSMGRFYPELSMETADDGDLLWEGVIKTWTGNGYEVRLRYPDSFPYKPPKAFVVNPKIEQSRHIYKDGHLCLFHKDDKSWEPKTTAATVMSWVSLWLHCYEVWLETGNWPRREHDEVVIETDY